MAYKLNVTEHADELLDHLVDYLVNNLKNEQAAKHLLFQKWHILLFLI